MKAIQKSAAQLTASFGMIAVLAILFVIRAALAGTDPIAQSGSQEWLKQYDEIQQRIQSRALYKSSAAVEGSIVDANALILPSDHDPADVVLRRTEALLRSFKQMRNAPAGLSGFERQLNMLKQRNTLSGSGMAKSAALSRQDLFLQTRALQKTLALTNPLLDFDTILCVGYIPSCGQQCHMVDQYLGRNALNGGGLYKVTGFKPGGASTARVN
jgi:hypothetical protein